MKLNKQLYCSITDFELEKLANNGIEFPHPKQLKLLLKH